MSVVPDDYIIKRKKKEKIDPPTDIHMLTMLEGAPHSSGVDSLPSLPSSGSSPTSLQPPTPPPAPAPAVRYRPMRKMCKRPAKKYRS